MTVDAFASSQIPILSHNLMECFALDHRGGEKAMKVPLVLSVSHQGQFEKWTEKARNEDNSS